MKKLKIVVSNGKHEQLSGRLWRIIKKTIRIGLCSIVVLSFLLRGIFFYDIKHASKYDKIVKEYKASEDKNQTQQLNEEQIQLNKNLNKEFFSCIKEVNGEILNEEDSKSFYSLNLDSQFDKINDYLQEKKTNVYNLDIYLLKDQKTGNDERRYWKVVKGKELFAIDSTKALLTNNLTKLVNFIQGFFPRWAKTQDFLFCSEIFIKVFIFLLLTRILQESLPPDSDKEVDFQNTETLNEYLFELFLKFVYRFVSFLHFTAPFMSMLPPLDLQQVRFSSKWTILFICTILTSALLEECTEENTAESDKEKNIFLRKNFQFKIILGILSSIFFIFVNRYFIKNGNCSKRNNFIAESIGWLLFLTDKLISSTMEGVIHWKNKSKREKNEKAL